MAFRILYYETLDSTNNLALQFAKEGAVEATVIVAEHQSKGRGRFERKWTSPRGKGLLFSIILRPQVSASSASILTHLAAQSVADVLHADFDLPAKLKKPNDVLVGGKKIAGILTESSTLKGQIEHVVVGIGLNVNTGKGQLLKTATSIAIESGQKGDINTLLNRILTVFLDKYEDIVGVKKHVKKASKAGNFERV
jgi:BirA family transcriptional regulator, biotin operon repressor / biotin---[acetyl-CoA-carboxylase] ligase